MLTHNAYKEKLVPLVQEILNDLVIPHGTANHEELVEKRIKEVLGEATMENAAFHMARKYYGVDGFSIPGVMSEKEFSDLFSRVCRSITSEALKEAYAENAKAVSEEEADEHTLYQRLSKMPLMEWLLFSGKKIYGLPRVARNQSHSGLFNTYRAEFIDVINETTPSARRGKTPLNRNLNEFIYKRFLGESTGYTKTTERSVIVFQQAFSEYVGSMHASEDFENRLFNLLDFIRNVHSWAMCDASANYIETLKNVYHHYLSLGDERRKFRALRKDFLEGNKGPLELFDAVRTFRISVRQEIDANPSFEFAAMMQDFLRSQSLTDMEKLVRLRKYGLLEMYKEFLANK